MQDLCTNCTKRNLCSSLCPEAEMYASQDEVKLRELTVGAPEYGSLEWPEPIEKPLFTKREQQVISRLLDGKSREEIALDLGITRDNVRNIIQRIRKKRNKFKLKKERQDYDWDLSS